MSKFFNKLFFEPNLLIPNVKPVGTVVVDVQHALARDLRWAFLMKDELELLTGKGFTLNNGANLVEVGGQLYLSTDGTNDYAQLSSSDFDLTFSNSQMSGLFKIKATDIAQWMPVFARHGSSAQLNPWFGFNNSKQLYLNLNGSATNTTTTYVGQDIVIGFTINGSSAALYANGDLVASGTLGSFITASDGNCWLGADTVSGDYYNGLIETGFIWSRALEIAEMESASNDIYQMLRPQIDYVWAASNVSAITSSINVTEEDDTASISVAVEVVGTVNVTAADDTAALTTTVSDDAPVNVTEEDDTANITVSISANVSGSIDVTEEDDTVAITAIVNNPTIVNITEEDDTANVDVIVDSPATVSITEEDDTCVATGIVGVVSGSVDVVEEDDVCQANGFVGTQVAAANIGGRHASMLWQ